MIALPFALYGAFSDSIFGGSQGAVISDAHWLDADTRLRIAKEIGAPATCFVSSCNNRSVSARFQSPLAEYPMCGHGTICLMTRMVEQGVLQWHGDSRITVSLCLPSATATVEIYRQEDNRPLVLLDIQTPDFRFDSLDYEELSLLLNLNRYDFCPEWPIETASGDFTHLVVPVRNLLAMRKLKPDFEGLTQFCNTNKLQTIALFCTEVEQADYQLHVRDFCPAVGVAESAAAGTTNAALTSYMIRHKIVQQIGEEQIHIQAEQGMEINRPSCIRSIVSMSDGHISRLQIGGVATKVSDGQLHLPN